LTTKTTIHLTLGRAASWLDRWQIPPALVVAVLILLIAAGISGISRLRSERAAAAAPTPGLIILIATQPANVPPTAVPPIQVAAIQPTTPRYVVAWSAPDGDVLGPIPAPAASALLGRWGDGWVATTWEGATVWIRAADLGLSLANLAPQIAPEQPAGPRVVTVEQPQAPQPAEQPGQPYQTANQPPTPEPAAQPAQAPALPLPIAPPATLAPMEQNDVTQEWARQQYLSEHPEVNR